MAFVVLGMCMVSCVGVYALVRQEEEKVLDERQDKKLKNKRTEDLLAALGDVKSIEAQTIELVNDQPLNIQDFIVYDKMEYNMVKPEMITGGYDTPKVSVDLGAMTQIPSIMIVNNNDNGSVVGAKIVLLDDSGKIVHESTGIKDVADAYEYDPNFRSWSKLAFSKIGRNEDGTKIS